MSNDLTGRLKSMVRRVEPAGLVRLRVGGFLADMGWFRSFATRQSVGAGGEPIPWLSYPCLLLLEQRIQRDVAVFEYGSGNSTLWFAARVDTVVACEHHEGWYQHVSTHVPEQVEVIHRELGPAYIQAVSEREASYDLVLVDGRERVACAREAAKALTDRGVIVWDDSDRARYRDGVQALVAQGFRELPLIGMSPITPDRKQTSILYRPGNWLGL